MEETKKIVSCKMIKVEKDDKDTSYEVALDFGDEYGAINFNDDDQNKLKELFGKLLCTLLEGSIEIKLEKPDEEIKPSFLNDVSHEYIKQLNKELNNIRDHLNERFADAEKSD